MTNDPDPSRPAPAMPLDCLTAVQPDGPAREKRKAGRLLVLAPTAVLPESLHTPLATLLAELERCDLVALRQHWQARWGAPPPLRSVDLLRLMLAWRLQAEALGGFDRTARRQIARTGRLQPEGQELGLGARLRREWQGRMVEVVVTPEGFRCDDRVFRSLSAAATAIAGSRWSGPRLFGLRGGDQ